MCGIVGFITAENAVNQTKRLNYLRDALIVDVLRGEDSTGVLFGHSMQKGATPGYVKDVLAGYDFVNSKAYAKYIERERAVFRFAVGHNRASTLGSTTVDNAHPFAYQYVTGVHNGTVRGNLGYLPISKSASGRAVDSDCIMQNLNHVDPGDAAKEVLEKIDGAYMLVWYDSRDGTLNFARNNTRSFHLAQSYDEETVFFASEANELRWIGGRNTPALGEIMSLKPGQHLKFNDEGGVVPTVSEFKPFVKPPVSNKWKGKPASGKGQSAVVPNYVNKTATVPDLLEAELNKHKLTSKDEYKFKPMTVRSDGTLRYITEPRFVSGYIDSLGMNAVCHRVEKLSVDKAINRSWTVRPIAIKYMGEDNSPVAVCDLVMTHPSSEKRNWRQQEPAKTYIGPDGDLISAREWMALTKEGCSGCEKVLPTSQRESVTWEQLTGLPLCGDCTAEEERILQQIADRHGEYYGATYH